MVKRELLFGLLVGALITACAGFKYRYYGLDAESYEGKLLGPKPEQDLPFSLCEPDQAQKGKCAVMFIDELERLRADLIEMRERLKACEENQS